MYTYMYTYVTYACVYIYKCVCVCMYVCVITYPHLCISSCTVHDAPIHRPILTEYLEDQRTRSFLSGIIILACETSKSNMSKASTCHEWPQENSNPVPSTTLTFEILWVSSCQMGAPSISGRTRRTKHSPRVRLQVHTCKLEESVGPCDFRCEQSSPGESMWIIIL